MGDVTGLGFAVFDTVLGTCGIAWQGSAIAGVQLPNSSAARTRTQLRGRFPDAGELPSPAEVARVIDEIIGLLRGEPHDLRTAQLDTAGVGEFERKVYAAAREIPPGSTSTYGAIATSLGAPGSARAVGHALGNNPFPIIVPCHRVLAADGKVGGFSAPGGARTKLRMLALEGAGEPALFDL